MLRNISETLKKHDTIFLIIVLNIFFLFIFIQTPIYNNSIYLEDSGIYQNIAKEIMNGKVLYKDVFDHKGPFIFFIYLIPLLLRNINLGLYFIDTIIHSSIFYLNYKTIKLNKHNITTYLLILIELILLFISHRVVSPESISLLIISYLNYWILSKQYLNPTKTQLIICGILTGLIFWIKFTLGVYIAIIYFYFLYIHIINKTFNYKYILIPLIGALIPTSIVFGYFIYNNAVFDLFNAYFLINTKYKNPTNLNIDFKLITLTICSIFLLFYNIKKKEKDYIILSIAYLIFIIPVFIMTKNNWNNLYAPFIAIVPLFSNINIKRIKPQTIYFTTGFILILFIYILSLYNISFKEESKESIITNEFIKDINEEPESIASLYMISTEMLKDIKNINYKYFFTPCLTYDQYPEMWDKIYNDIKNKNIEYLVTYPTPNSEHEFFFNKQFNDSKITIETINKINEELHKNYDIFNEYNGFLVFKRKN